MNNQRRLINTRDAAKYLCISQRKLWSLTNENRIASVKFDRVVRFDINDLDDFIRCAKGGE